MTKSHPIESDLSVVIPTLGRPILRKCLESLEAGETWPACVIVVDQGRNTQIEALLQEVHTRGLSTLYVPSSQTGRAAGVNRGIERAKSRFVAVTDDDCIVEGDWVARMAARLRENPSAILTGRVDQGEGDVVLAVVTSTVPVVQRRPALRFDRLSGGNMGMKTALAARVGLFDEDPCMRTAEDAEFAYRALRAGVPLIYAPDVAVRHLGWRGPAEREAQYRSYARSHGGFFGKYLRKGDLFIALRTAVHLLRALRRWAVGTLRRDREIALHGRAYVLGLLPGIVAGWRSSAVR